MAIQIIAIRLTSEISLEHIEEVIWRADHDGDVHPASRELFAQWMIANPTELVYTRNIAGDIAIIEAVNYNGRLYLRTVSDRSNVDNLLTLPRFVTKTP